MQTSVSIGSIEIGNDLPFVLIAGPCTLETTDQAIDIAGQLAETCLALGVSYIFKASYDKANRSSGHSYRGPGLDQGLKMLQQVKETIGCPVLTDIHSVEECAPVSKVVDCLQIPALLSRQTDLIKAAAETGKAVNVKKGQFMAPEDMVNVAAKAQEAGSDQILLTERGTSFGYHNLVVDMRGVAKMRQTGFPTIIDATHAVQLPAASGEQSDGDRRFAPAIARAAISLGIAGAFVETHPKPDSAPCDGPNMISLADMPAFIKTLKAFDQIAKAEPITLME